MARALALAERGRGRTSPNPMVGAVVVDEEGVVVGCGAHEFAGGPHAEIRALADAGGRARLATLYCTLEPCSHTGRTGPCAPRVVEAGICRVVVAGQDPNPLVAGKGLAHLREHGLEVSVGILRGAAERLNAPFFTVMRRGRPFVTMKIALSREDHVSAREGTRTQLTGAAANRLIHRERAEVDAIAVGSRTVVIDDPLLTPRGAYRVRPLARIVFDRSLSMPPTARVLSTLDAGPVIVVGTTPRDAAGNQRLDALTAAGARVELAGAGNSFLSDAFAMLPGLGISSLMLEGGPTLHSAAWRAGVVDRVQVFRTPRSFGSAGVPWFQDVSFLLEHLEDVMTTGLGDDVLTEGYVHRAD
jgi:diaminohydroxyphosphoribosylaminopyrimidine deaminase/5-amino-6-(5-phosphoribosylamino)uracil reductase